MKVVWTDHARVRQGAWEERLGISASTVERVARSPEQVVPGRGRARVTQARWQHGLIRVIFVDHGEERRLITVYWTSQVDRYWRGGYE